MKKKRIIFVLALIALAAAAVPAYMYLDEHIKIEPRKFSKEKESTASKLYDKIMIDLEANYPASPEGVIDHYNDAFYLMYANMIVNDGTLFEVMMKQREVYSSEIKTKNPENIQFENLKNALEDLYAGKHICLSVERKGTIYDEKTPDECVVQVEAYYNTFGSLYRNYYLVREDGRWRIRAWLTTDENYTDTR